METVRMCGVSAAFVVLCARLAVSFSHASAPRSATDSGRVLTTPAAAPQQRTAPQRATLAGVFTTGPFWCLQTPEDTEDDAEEKRDYESLEKAWVRKRTVDAYKQRADTDAPWYDDAVALLELFASDITRKGTVRPQPYLRAAEPLTDTECTDPLVLHAIGHAYARNGQLTEAEPFLARAADAYPNAEYSPWLYWVLAARLARVYAITADQAAVAAHEWAAEAVAAVLKTVTQADLADGGHRLLWAEIRDNFMLYLHERRQELCDALIAEDEADQWIVHMFAGEYHYDKAFEARGGDFYPNLTEEQKKGFEQHIPKAGEHFTKAWQLHPDYPEGPTGMIERVTAQWGYSETTKLWFNRAIWADPRYMPAYEAMLWALQPQWGGDTLDLYDFGVNCLATGWFQTEIPKIYLRVLRRFSRDYGRDNIWTRYGEYEKLSKLFAGIIDEPSRPAKNWYRSRWAGAARKCRRYDEAKRMLDELGDDLVEDAFMYIPETNIDNALGEVKAMTGPQADQLREAMVSHVYGWLSAAIEEYTEAAKDIKDPQAATYVNGRVSVIRVEKAVRDYEWRPFQPEPGLGGWLARGGEWEVTPDGTLAVTAPTNWVFLMCKAVVEGDYQIQGQVVFDTEGTPGNGGVRLGCRLGRGHFWLDDFILQYERQEAYFFGKGRPVELHEVNDFDIKVRGFKATAHVNGELVGEDVEMRKEGHGYMPDGHAAFVTRGSKEKGARVEFRNVRIRRLPPPETDTADTPDTPDTTADTKDTKQDAEDTRRRAPGTPPM